MKCFGWLLTGLLTVLLAHGGSATAAVPRYCGFIVDPGAAHERLAGLVGETAKWVRVGDIFEGYLVVEIDGPRVFVREEVSGGIFELGLVKPVFTGVTPNSDSLRKVVSLPVAPCLLSAIEIDALSKSLSVINQIMFKKYLEGRGIARIEKTRDMVFVYFSEGEGPKGFGFRRGLHWWQGS